MSFKSKKQPLCRYCGKPIKKWTGDLYVYAEPPRTHTPVMRTEVVAGRFTDLPTGEMRPIHVPKHVIGQPRSREEAQKLTNLKVISIKRGADGVIDQMGVWDGESYADAFFCKGTCASSYAYAMAALEGEKHTLQFRPYREALAKQKEKANGQKN